MGTTIKDYARSRGVSHEAVRRQLKRYSDELEGHITIQGRSKYLDDEAVEFLDQHRLPKTIVIDPTDEEAKKEIEELKAKLDLMKDQVQDLQNHAIALQGEIINLQREKIDLIADKTRSQLLIEAKDKESSELKDKTNELQNQLEEAKKESSRYVKSWFGLYRRKDD